MRIIKNFISKRALNGVMMTRWYKLTKYFSHSAYESEKVGIGVLLEYQKLPVLIELAGLSENKKQSASIHFSDRSVQNII